MTDAFYIADSHLAVRYYDQLRVWFESEWDKIDPFHDGANPLPRPIVALTPKEILAGGLAFTQARSPLSDDPEIWINAVLVSPEYRRQGLATLLIQSAEHDAQQAKISCLFALTDLPTLYAKIGWSVVSNSEGNYVMMREINRAP